MLHGCSVVELRQYTLHDGTRERLIDLFENEFIESQEALGIRVIGPFRDLEDPNRFVWLRGFPDMNERGRMLSAFIHYVDSSAIRDFTQFFENTMNPVLANTGAHVIATFETEPATNTFSRLPVRESETVLIWLAAFRDTRQFEDHVTALHHLPDWRKHAPQDVLRQFSRKPEVLKLAPTPRSQLQN